MKPVSVAIALLLAMSVRPAISEGADAQRKALPSERAADPNEDPRILKAKISALQAAIRKASQPRLRRILDQQQAHFDAESSKCRADVPCLRAGYTGRLAILEALSARVSDANPLLPDATSVALIGTWRAGSLRSLDPGKPAGSRVLEDGIPDPETEIRGASGQLCTTECDTFGLEPGRLDRSAEGRAVARSAGIDSSSNSYLAYFNGRASFTIVPMPDGRLLAMLTACGPHLENCAPAVQEWSAVSADAALKILQP